MAGMLILSAYFTKTSVLMQQRKERLLINATSGLQYVLADDNAVKMNESINFDLYENQEDSVLLTRKQWGVFQIAACVAFKGKDSVAQTAMYGFKPDAILQSALYVSDQNRPLYLCGDTKLKGLCYIPEAGVKRAYIEGQGYINNKLIEGEEKQSKTSLPPLSETLSQTLAATFNKLQPTFTEPIDKLPDTLYQSFSKPTIVVQLPNGYRLENKHFSGNIILYSNGKIELSNTNKLQDIQLYASSIVIKERFLGTIQAFVQDSLLVEKNCTLNYPSALGVIKNKFEKFQQFVQIGENSMVKGILIGYCKVEDLAKIRISMDKDAILLGQLYADGFAELKGKVYGNVTCGKLLLRTPSSTYENHLLNTTLDYSQLPKNFVGSALLPTQNIKKVIRYYNW